MKCSPLVNRTILRNLLELKRKSPLTLSPSRPPQPPASPGDQTDRGELIFITEVAGGEEREAQSVMLLHCEE